MESSELKGSGMKGSYMMRSKVKGSEMKGSDVESSEVKGSETKGSDMEGSEPRGSDMETSKAKGSEVKGSETALAPAITTPAPAPMKSVVPTVPTATGGHSLAGCGVERSESRGFDAKLEGYHVQEPEAAPPLSGPLLPSLPPSRRRGPRPPRLVVAFREWGATWRGPKQKDPKPCLPPSGLLLL